MGTQLDSFISPDMYRSDIRPRLEKLIAFIKGRAPHVRMMMHSCGSIRRVIPDLIDDVLVIASAALPIQEAWRTAYFGSPANSGDGADGNTSVN